jgi:hypothetical protein
MASSQFKQHVRWRGQQCESWRPEAKARPVTVVRERIHLSDRYDRTNEIQIETRGVHQGGHGGATRRCSASDQAGSARLVTLSVAVS